MKKKYAAFQIVLGICAAIGWWGVLYPELTMTPDTYRIVNEDGTVQTAEDGVKYPFGETLYYELLNVGGKQIHFKSKLVTAVEGMFQK
jgi:hypothetical protein